MKTDANHGPAGAAGEPWVIAHRGASQDRPENTLAAFDEALRQGAEGIELDLQLSRDGVPVVYHDRTLAKVGLGRKRIASLDLREIAGIDAGYGLDKEHPEQHIPTLKQVLERYGRRVRLLLEVKTREGRTGRARHLELARSVAAHVKESGAVESASILSFDADVLHACAETAPEVARVLNVKPTAKPSRNLRVLFPLLQALSVDMHGLTPGFAASIRRAGLPLLAFTCNSARRVEQALDCGVSGIMTDRPGWLAGYLDARRRTRGT